MGRREKGVRKMGRKIIGIFVVTLLIASGIVSANIKKVDGESEIIKASNINNPPHLDDFDVNRSEIKKGEKVMFTMKGNDPDNDKIRYYLDPKSDGNYTRSFLGPSGNPFFIVNVIYNDSGSYIATAWCEDEHGTPSDNNLTLNINVKKKGISVVITEGQNNFIISKTREINTLFLNFLENHPYLFPMLRQLLELQ